MLLFVLKDILKISEKNIYVVVWIKYTDCNDS